MSLNLSSLGEPIRRRPGQLFFCCPYCDDTKGHLGVNTVRGIFHCFKCDASGKLDELQPNLNQFTEKVKARLSPDQRKVLSNLFPSLPNEYQEIKEDCLAFKYLKQRNITWDEIERYEIGYCPSGFFKHRIIIPIYEREKLLYFVGRTYLGANPRYMNSPTPKKGIIFKTFTGTRKEVVICEGIYDALRIQKVTEAIALLGKKIDDDQIKKIKGVCEERVLVMLDKDARKEAFEIYQKLSLYRDTKIVMISQKDPGEMTATQIEEALYE